jgi:release factor glutamine methyltransferase
VASVREVVLQASIRLGDCGVPTPRLDAEVLLAHVLGVGREHLVVAAADPVDPVRLGRFEELMQRRLAREPVAYILGRKPFRHIELAVDRRVLIPRPETELLVEVGLGLPAGGGVVDVGTGCGAVALALKHERPDLRVMATDISRDVLAVARRNGERLGLDVAFVEADLLVGVEGPFDAVLANLPYVADGAELQPEISMYEPPGALFAGPDGLEQIRRLVGLVGGVPLVALELGFDQASAVAGLLAQAGFRTVKGLRDLAGHERVVVGRL